VARIDASKRRAFERLADRDSRRGTNRNAYLLLARRFAITPAWRVKGIVGYRPRMTIVEVAASHVGRRPLNFRASARGSQFANRKSVA
jgi:hypothetical protein